MIMITTIMIDNVNNITILFLIYTCTFVVKFLHRSCLKLLPESKDVQSKLEIEN